MKENQVTVKTIKVSDNNIMQMILMLFPLTVTRIQSYDREYEERYLVNRMFWKKNDENFSSKKLLINNDDMISTAAWSEKKDYRDLKYLFLRSMKWSSSSIAFGLELDVSSVIT